jgi:hypothetical protein
MFLTSIQFPLVPSIAKWGLLVIIETADVFISVPVLHVDSIVIPKSDSMGPRHIAIHEKRRRRRRKVF